MTQPETSLFQQRLDQANRRALERELAAYKTGLRFVLVISAVSALVLAVVASLPLICARL